jgi:hypothetical protein
VRAASRQFEFANTPARDLPSARVFQREQHHDNDDLAFIRKMDERNASH